MMNGNQDKTVGVITLPGNFNYGNRLQLFAACHIYSSLGFTTHALELGRSDPAFIKGLKKIKHTLASAPPAPEALMSPERKEAFARFSKCFTTKAIPEPDDRLDETYDFISVGSDQVWNPAYIIPHQAATGLSKIVYKLEGGDAARSDWYFARFVGESKRIALSPSIGLDALTPAQSSWLAEGVRGFSRLSVRERRGAELIKECSGRDAEVICDPTLVLSADEWRSVASGCCTPEGDYVFTYLLGGVSEEARAVLDQVTDYGRLPVVPLSDREKPEEPPAGPAEFIDLIDHAKHVVTDSFHASVFSAILGTPLTIVQRKGTGSSMFSRLETLADTLGIQDKLYVPGHYDLSHAADYDQVPERIAAERRRFLEYLKGRIDG